MGNYIAPYIFDDKKTVLSDKYSAGPWGLGDPDDKSLRKVEKSVLIQRIISEKARNEYCRKEMSALTECSRNKYISMLWTCRPEAKALRTCLEKAYYDEELKEECTKEYLDRRSEYRRTGIKKESKRAFGPKVHLPPPSKKLQEEEEGGIPAA